MSAKERVISLSATLAGQRAVVADLEAQLYAARAVMLVTQQEIRALHFEAWLEDDRVEFPTPAHGTETLEIYGSGHRERVVRWVESRTEKGSIRLATEIRQPNRKPERRTAMTLRVGTADYITACREFGLRP